MKKLDLPTVSATGQVTIQGSLSELDLQSLGDGSTDTFLLVNATSGNPLTLNVGASISHASITANGGIASLTAGEWINPASPGSADTLQAPYITEIASKSPAAGGVSGNFMPDVTTSGTDPKGKYSLRKAQIGGTVSGVWQVGTVSDEIYANQAGDESKQLDWYLESTGVVHKVGVGTTYDNTGKASPGLQAVSFGEIDFFGEVEMGGVEATGAAANGFAIDMIKVLAPKTQVATATYLPVTATAGDIGVIVADDWPSTATIATKYLGTLRQVDSNGSFQAGLSLTGPEQELDNAIIAGTLGYQGLTAGLQSTWSFAGKLGTIRAANVDNWILQGTTNSSVDTLRSYGDFRNSTVSVANVNNYLAAAVFAYSTITVSNNLNQFIVSPDPTATVQFDSTNVTTGMASLITVRNANTNAGLPYSIRVLNGFNAYLRLTGVTQAASIAGVGATNGTLDQSGSFQFILG